jgi:hypothetical protein
MRPWIRWSSLALALCNTGCGEYQFECDTQTPVAVQAGQILDVTALVGQRCKVFRGDPTKPDREAVSYYVRVAPPTVTTPGKPGGPPTVFAYSGPGEMLREGASVVELIVPSDAQVGWRQELKLSFWVGDQQLASQNLRLVLTPQSTQSAFSVSPSVVDLSLGASSVSMMADLGESANGQSVSWLVASPGGETQSIEATDDGAGNFSAHFEPSTVGRHIITAVVNQERRAAYAVDVVRGVRFLGPPVVASYSQSLTRLVFASFDLSEPAPGPSVVATRADRLTGEVPTEIVDAGGRPGDHCRLAAVLNNPRHQAIGERIQGEFVSGLTVSDRASVVSADSRDQIVTDRCDMVVAEAPANNAPPQLSIAEGPCSRAVWSGKSLASGVYRVRVCVTASMSTPTSVSVDEVFQRCDAARSYFIGFDPENPRCRGE